MRGVLISPVEEITGRLEQLRRRGTPSVLVDRMASTPGFSSVSVDDVVGGRTAVQHLLDGGRRRILFVGGPLDLEQVRDRLTGAREAVAGVPGATLEVLPDRRADRPARRRRRARDPRDGGAARTRSSPRTTSSRSACCRPRCSAACRIPDELALVGYDDIEFAASAGVPITSMRQPRDRMGAIAVDLLLSEIDGVTERSRIVLQPELVVRESSSPR